MIKNKLRPFWVPLLMIPIGGAIMVALTLALYFGIYILLEAVFFSNNPMDFPAAQLRRGCTILLVGLYLMLLPTKLPDLLKAILLPGPLAASIITTGHALYLLPVVSVIGMFGVVAVCGILLYRSKKPWIYYYAGVVGALTGLAVAWPASLMIL